MGAAASTLGTSTKVGKFELDPQQQRQMDIISNLFQLLLQKNNLMDFAELSQTQGKACENLIITLSAEIEKEFQQLRLTNVKGKPSDAAFVSEEQYQILKNNEARKHACDQIAFFLLHFVLLVAALTASIAIMKGDKPDTKTQLELYEPVDMSPYKTELIDPSILKTLVTSRQMSEVRGSNETLYNFQGYILNTRGLLYQKGEKSKVFQIKMDWYTKEGTSSVSGITGISGVPGTSSAPTPNTRWGMTPEERLKANYEQKFKLKQLELDEQRKLEQKQLEFQKQLEEKERAQKDALAEKERNIARQIAEKERAAQQQIEGISKNTEKQRLEQEKLFLEKRLKSSEARRSVELKLTITMNLLEKMQYAIDSLNMDGKSQLAINEYAGLKKRFDLFKSSSLKFQETFNNELSNEQDIVTAASQVSETDGQKLLNELNDFKSRINPTNSQQGKILAIGNKSTVGGQYDFFHVVLSEPSSSNNSYGNASFGRPEFPTQSLSPQSQPSPFPSSQSGGASFSFYMDAFGNTYEDAVFLKTAGRPPKQYAVRITEQLSSIFKKSSLEEVAIYNKAAEERSQNILNFAKEFGMTPETITRFSTIASLLSSSATEIVSPAALRAYLLLTSQVPNGVGTSVCSDKDPWYGIEIGNLPAYGLLGLLYKEYDTNLKPIDTSLDVAALNPYLEDASSKETMWGKTFKSASFPAVDALCNEGIKKPEHQRIFFTAYNELKAKYTAHLKQVADFMKTIFDIDQVFIDTLASPYGFSTKAPILRLNPIFVKSPRGAIVELAEKTRVARDMISKHYADVESIYTKAIVKLNEVVVGTPPTGGRRTRKYRMKRYSSFRKKRVARR